MKDINTIELVSLATKVGHSTAAQIAYEANDEQDGMASIYWMNACVSVFIDVDRLEQALQTLGTYVCTRRDPVLPEQLYRKAAELGFHKLPVDGFHQQEPWLQATYAVFASAARTVHDTLKPFQSEVSDQKSEVKNENETVAASAPESVAAPAEGEGSPRDPSADPRRHGAVHGGGTSAQAEAGATAPPPVTDDAREVLPHRVPSEADIHRKRKHR